VAATLELVVVGPVVARNRPGSIGAGRPVKSALGQGEGLNSHRAVARAALGYTEHSPRERSGKLRAPLGGQYVWAYKYWAVVYPTAV